MLRKYNCPSLTGRTYIFSQNYFPSPGGVRVTGSYSAENQRGGGSAPPLWFNIFKIKILKQ